MIVGSFTYKHHAYEVTKTPRDTFRVRPADGKPFSKSVNPTNFCKALRRWRVRYDQRNLKHIGVFHV